MTDREELGRRMVEAMGWEQHWNTPTLYIIPLSVREALGLRYGEWVSVKDIVSWPGYGIVDAWMREQGWCKEVRFHACVKGESYMRYCKPGIDTDEAYLEHGDEPIAAIEAALKALEGNHE